MTSQDPSWLRRARYHREEYPKPEPLVTVLWLMWIAIASIALAWWAGFIEFVP